MRIFWHYCSKATKRSDFLCSTGLLVGYGDPKVSLKNMNKTYYKEETVINNKNNLLDMICKKLEMLFTVPFF